MVPRVLGVLLFVLVGCGPLHPPGPFEPFDAGSGASCSGQTCSSHGSCSMENGVPTCRCDFGFIAPPSNRLSCVPDQSATGCGGGCCSGGQQSYCSQAPCGTTAGKVDCCILVGGSWNC